MLMSPANDIADYARDPTLQEIAKDNPKKEKVLNVILRKTESF